MKLGDVDRSNLVPDGEYIVKLKDFKYKVKNAGYLACEYSVIEGEYKGKTLWDNVSLSQNTIGIFLVPWLYALGEGDDADWPSIEEVSKGKYTIDEQGFVQQARSLVGNACRVSITTRIPSEEDKRERNFKDRNEIKGYYPANDATNVGGVSWGEDGKQEKWPDEEEGENNDTPDFGTT